jgi:hypothetical protein
MTRLDPGQVTYKAYNAGRPCAGWTHPAVLRAKWAAAEKAAVERSPAAVALREQLATAITARDEYRDNAVLHVRERDKAREQLAIAVRAFRDIVACTPSSLYAHSIAGDTLAKIEFPDDGEISGD